MTIINTETPVMDQIIDRAIEQNPHTAELLKAFGPIINRQRALTGAIALPKVDYSSLDKEKLRAGVSVIQQINLFSPQEPFKEVALSLAESVKKGMPALAGEMGRLSDLIAQDKLRVADYFKKDPNLENRTLDRWCRDLNVFPSNATFLLSLVARVLLERRAMEATAAVGEFTWEKGYCPICGDFPSIALIEEEGGRRFLHCSSCGQDWRFTRVVCPYCEKETPREMDYFYVENKTQESAFVCGQCNKYLITLYRAGRLLARDMDISAISLVHLDMIMQEKGYEPMAVCVWNALT
ncbi:MAG: formate dehydrogenase accessory protein FdhE [Deltaproteobacteria bacterium]|nr:formate dehydrogenase accessory protein FdhE [Deltaproteobacteria bacterium]